MAEDDGHVKPDPDPTVLTTEQLVRAIRAERDVVNAQLDVLRERLNGIDRATELRFTGILDTPKLMDEKVGHLEQLTEQRFDSIQTQFKERDTRSEREARDNKVAVDAAFAAQKEAASEQNRSNSLAISKSETSTAETITKLAELFQTTTNALSDKIEDLKERTGRIESVKQGQTEVRREERAAVGSTTQVVGAIVAVILVALAFYAAMRSNTNGNGVPPAPAAIQASNPTEV